LRGRAAKRSIALAALHRRKKSTAGHRPQWEEECKVPIVANNSRLRQSRIAEIRFGKAAARFARFAARAHETI
jgi:hypothetical protein